MPRHRIKEEAKAQGITLEKIAENIGISQSYFSRLVSGGRSIRLKHIEDAAKVLGVPVASLLVDERITSSTTSNATKDRLINIPVVGYIQAGNWGESGVMDAALEELHIPVDPRWGKAQPVAFKVLGDSYDEFVKEGGYVIALQHSDMPVELKKGMHVIAERSRYDGQLVERTLKMVFPLRNGSYELKPRSSNKKHKTIRFPSSEKETLVTVFAVVTTFVQPAYWPD